MRIIVLFFTLFHIGVSFAFAPALEISSDVSRVKIGESFDIIIDVFPEDSELIINTIGGIENFSFLGESKSERYVNINGKVQTENKYYFTLVGKNQGVFTLGPVNADVGSATLQTNTIEIEVFGDNASTASISDKPSDILDIFESSDRKMSLNYLPFLFLIFFVLFFLLIQKLIKKPEQKSTPAPEVRDSQHDILVSRLKTLRQQSKLLGKSDFYSEFNSIIRDYFSLLGYKNTQKMTLKEIQKLGIKNADILGVFTQSYTREFDTKTDTQSQRKKLIDDFIHQLQK